jgi:2-polyprenyl-3-methyl-5-hydroxy-6-metoxy-1,4-benzoquinol methylase
MKIEYLGTDVKWQKIDKRNVPDVRNKVANDVEFPSGLILEIGCAAGNFFRAISNLNKEYVGIDLDCKQVNRAKKRFPNETFICGDILKRDDLIKKCKTIISFQVFEHIQYDFKMFDKIESGKNIVFSVPNFPYRSNSPDGHKRHYELDGWVKRYESIVDFSDIWVIKHYIKERCIFVFQGVKR